MRLSSDSGMSSSLLPSLRKSSMLFVKIGGTFDFDCGVVEALEYGTGELPSRDRPGLVSGGGAWLSEVCRGSRLPDDDGSRTRGGGDACLWSSTSCLAAAAFTYLLLSALLLESPELSVRLL